MAAVFAGSPQLMGVIKLCTGWMVSSLPLYNDDDLLKRNENVSIQFHKCGISLELSSSSPKCNAKIICMRREEDIGVWQTWKGLSGTLSVLHSLHRKKYQNIISEDFSGHLKYVR